ncbi:MAG: transporter substrate-binding domain-containing protein [Burkholderiales bacterium]|nr:transporter substrate-binding domain-containing protein [Burkholderiales bacterium]
MRLPPWILSFLLLLPAAPGAGATEVLQIYMPDVPRPSTEIARRILTQAYGRLGIPINFFAAPAARGLSMWNNGEIDAVGARLLDSGLPDAIKIPVPIVYEEGVVYTVKRRFKVAGYDSLKPYTVGYIANIAYLKDKLKVVPHQITAPNLESLFRMLAAGRTEVAVDSRYAQCTAKKLGLNEIAILEPAVDAGLGYHYLHARRQSLAAPLERVLRAMEKDGTLKKIQDETMREFMAQCN